MDRIADYLRLGCCRAETVTVKCAGQEFGKPYVITLVYEGEDSGSMTVGGSFGEMSLPAAKKQREGAITDGDVLRDYSGTFRACSGRLAPIRSVLAVKPGRPLRG